jgi:hypothetical protein
MSEAFTDIERDKKLEEKSDKIHTLENKFKEEPSSKLAEEIIHEMNELLVMPRGYFQSVNKINMREKRDVYIKYLKE